MQGLSHFFTYHPIFFIAFFLVNVLPYFLYFLTKFLFVTKKKPIVIQKKERPDYLKSLKTADESDLTKFKKEDYFDLVQFVSDEMISFYWNIFL